MEAAATKKNKRADIPGESVFEAIYDSAGCPLVILSVDGRFISGNSAALRLFGCGSLKKFTGFSFYDLSPKKQADGTLSSDAADKFIAHALKNGECKFEWLHKKIKGGKFFANVMLNRMKAGPADVLVAAIVDITEKKSATAKLEAVNEQLLKSNHSLQRMALVDSHTGLFNHRYMAQTVESEFFRAKRITRPLAALMLDIDYFKSINDVYGHKYGDMILKEFAEVLQGEVRKYDVVARFGGEEFVIILPGATRKTAFSLAQRILDKLAVYYFGWSEQKIKIKVSIGAASYPEDDVSKGMALIDLADDIMMKAKEDGGNRVYSALEAEDRPSIIKDASRKTVNIKDLQSTIQKLSKRSSQGLVEAIFAFAKTIKFKDLYTGEHVEETVHYATMITSAMKLSSREKEDICQAAILHDLGKVGISGNLLKKKGPLSAAEFDEIKRHPQIGADILKGVHGLSAVVPLILHHHEWWNGKGYPTGMKGNDIPLGSRIIAVADVYQSLISKRSYSRVYSPTAALGKIKKAAGSQFDPKIVKIFERLIKKTWEKR
ncbi:MAG: hypothetical protein COS41_03685 [Elusimicrobia bacterium CG03_land_8_20_14_0_80_50_18]|nr:MAG: hypothetical protein COS41_03685 [Elusimicrobia bacterium CG03_land_8_20_14_0_80_50_18]